MSFRALFALLLFAVVASVAIPRMSHGQPQPAKADASMVAAPAPASPISSTGTAVATTSPTTKPATATATATAATTAPKPAAPATLPVVDPTNPVQQVSFIIEAFKSGKWAWGVGLIIMLLTWLFNKLLKTRIPKKVVPWIAIALGVGTNVAMSFASGLPWYTALSNGFTMGLAAVGGWEALVKLFKTESTEPAAPSGSGS